MISGTSGPNFASTSQADFILSAGIANTGYVIIPATNGMTYSIPNNVTRVILSGTGLLLAATLILPVPYNNQDGKLLNIFSAMAITNLTLTPGTGSIISNTLTGLLANGKYQFLYCAANSTWFRCQ